MDPSCCSLCGRWVKRCECSSPEQVADTTDGPHSSALLTLLPPELSLIIWLRLPLRTLGTLACASKELRQATYDDSRLWEAMRKTASWAAAPSAVVTNARLVVRREVEIERNWRAGCYAASSVPIHRSRAHEKMDEVVGIDVMTDGRIVVTGLRPSTLQVWRSSCNMTHCVRSHRASDLFYCLLLPPAQPIGVGVHAPRSAADRALSADLRKERGGLWLWEVPMSNNRGGDGGGGGGGANRGAPAQRLCGHRRRVSSVAYCIESTTLASIDEGGYLIVWRLDGAAPVPLGQLYLVRHSISRSPSSESAPLPSSR